MSLSKILNDITKVVEKHEKLNKADETPPKTIEAVVPTPEAKENPRKRASKKTKQSLTSSEYKYARKSKFKNRGEDIARSARHIWGDWHGLAEAEEKGTAEKDVQLKNLLKYDPPDFSVAPEKKERSLHALAAHYIMQRFPKSPLLPRAPDAGHTWAIMEKPEGNQELWRTSDWMYQKGTGEYGHGFTEKGKVDHDALKRKAREIYFNMYTGLKKHLEDTMKTSETPAELLGSAQNYVGTRIRDAMRNAKDPITRMLMSSMFIHYHNKAFSYNAATSVRNALKVFLSNVMLKHGQGAENNYGIIHKHVHDLLEGMTIPETFGKEKKKVDRFNPVEAYLNHAARTGPAHGWKKSNDFEHFLDNISKMRGFQWGNYVSDAEREHHLKHTAYAMKDLTEALGLPESMGSYNGRLGFAVGARGKGKALAHYEPELSTINLTRASGVGSLAHEWMHFLDHALYGTIMDKPDNKEVLLSPVLGVVNKSPQYAKNKDVIDSMSKVKEYLQDKVAKRMHTDYMENRMPDNLSYSHFHSYWLSTHEMMARAFETYLQKKLHDKGRENTYLIGLKDHALWPNKQETAEITPLFDKLFASLKSSGLLKKSMKA